MSAPRTAVLVSMLAALSAAAQPAIDSPVVDAAHVLSADKREALATQLRAHQQKTGVQLALLLVDSTGGEPIETYALRAAVQWGGGDKRRDDGGLFVLAVKDRKMRVELGYGLEGLVTDGQAENALTALRPALRQGDYDGAAQQIADVLMTLTAPGVGGADVHVPVEPPRPPLLSPETRDLLVLALVWLAFYGVARLARWRMDQDGGPSLVQVLVLFVVLVVATTGAFVAAGQSWGVWWPATLGLVVGMTFGRQGSEGFMLALLWFAMAGFAPLVAAMLLAPNDHGLFLFILYGGQAALTGFFIVMGLGGASQYDSDGASWSRSSRSSSDWGSSSSIFSSSSSDSSSGSSWSSDSSSSFSSSSSSSDSYSGGGGSFGGGGASSDW